MSQTLLEKLQLKDERNLLIQGLPSSIEKQFAKLAFAKNVTPLLKIRKIDFALVFAVNENQLSGILNEVLPALHADGKLWVAYPKTTSKIATSLNRDCSWSFITHSGFEGVRQIVLDHVWTALRFKRTDKFKSIKKTPFTGATPLVSKTADRDSRKHRLETALGKLITGKKSPAES